MPYKDPEMRRAKSREYCRKWRAEHPGALKASPSYGAKYSVKTPEAARAHSAVHRALKRGDLVRPQSCQQCGQSCKPEAAHLDYARALVVAWLCRSCHRELDASLPKRGVWSETEHAAWRASRPRNPAWFCSRCGTQGNPRRGPDKRKFCSNACYVATKKEAGTFGKKG